MFLFLFCCLVVWFLFCVLFCSVFLRFSDALQVGGVPCNEMNVLEVEFLFMTNFSLFVTTDTYRQYYTELCNTRTTHRGVAAANSEVCCFPFIVYFVFFVRFL